MLFIARIFQNEFFVFHSFIFCYLPVGVVTQMEQESPDVLSTLIESHIYQLQICWFRSFSVGNSFEQAKYVYKCFVQYQVIDSYSNLQCGEIINMLIAQVPNIV